MNLVDHFEPQNIPENGLQSVTKAARRRAVKRRILASSWTAAVPLVMVGFVFAVNWSYGIGAAVDSGLPSADSARNNGTSAGPGNVQPDGLPGGTTRIDIVSGVLWFGFLYAILATVITVVTVTVHARRTPVPTLSTPRSVRRALIALWLTPVIVVGAGSLLVVVAEFFKNM